MIKSIFIPGHLLYDEVEVLAQKLGIALIVLVALVFALVLVIRTKPKKEGKLQSPEQGHED